jgi:NhaA family Na+:H+ antiporter
MVPTMLSTIREFLRLEAAAGIVLVLAAAVGLGLANSPLAGYYDALLDLPGELRIGPLEIRKPLLLWLNDGWMAVSFFLVGLEVKREFLDGELSDRRTAGLPVIGAMGGMVLPAAIYAWANWGDPVGLRGWAIPAATDIAFALGVISLLGKRVPVGLKVLLTAIAIIDDLGAIVIIAVFYTANLSLLSLALAAVALVALAVLNRAGVRAISPYVLVGAVLWVCVLKSGVHATLAGVATALAIPLRGGPSDEEPPLRRLEHALHPWVAYLILPAFAFANAGVSFAGLGLAALGKPVSLGIALGLFIGKQLGVLLAVWLAVVCRVGRLPDGASWMQLYGVAILCGIGFTMSLFIGGLAFDDVARAAEVRLGVLAGSLVSAVVGLVMLRAATRAA